MKNSNIAMVLMGSITLIATAGVVAVGTHEDHVTPAPIQTAPPPAATPATTPGTWSLIATDARGHDYVIDWNMSFEDCIGTMYDRTSAHGVGCHRQPDGHIPG